MKKLLVILTLACVFAVGASAQQRRGTYAEVYAPVMKASGDFTVPLKFINTQRGQVISYQFVMVYDPKVIEPRGENFGCDPTNTLSQNMSVVCNVLPVGTLRVAVYDAYGFTDPIGNLLNLNFRVVGVGESPLHFVDAFIHEGDPVSFWYDGTVSVE